MKSEEKWKRELSSQVKRRRKKINAVNCKSLNVSLGPWNGGSLEEKEAYITQEIRKKWESLGPK